MKYLVVLWPALALLACANNFAEMRPARVLRGGEVQITQGHQVVAPSGALVQTLNSAVTLAEVAEEGRALSEAEAQELLGGALAIAVQGPGYGSYLEFGLGLGYRFDLGLRLGNGVYGLQLRRGFDLGKWDANVGLRIAYSANGSWIPFAGVISKVTGFSRFRRVDAQLSATFGRDFREWGKFWSGAKLIGSAYSIDIDAGALDLGETRVADEIFYGGAFVGFALGYRYVFATLELAVLGAFGQVLAFGQEYDLGGAILVPSWGIRANW